MLIVISPLFTMLAKETFSFGFVALKFDFKRETLVRYRTQHLSDLNHTQVGRTCSVGIDRHTFFIHAWEDGMGFPMLCFKLLSYIDASKMVENMHLVSHQHHAHPTNTRSSALTHSQHIETHTHTLAGNSFGQLQTFS